MQQQRDQVGHLQVLSALLHVSVLLRVLCLPVIITHHDAEGAVARNAGDGTHAGNKESGFISEHIEHVLKEGEAQGNDGGIDDPVETVIKGLMFPGLGLQDHIFDAFLCHADDQEIHDGDIKKRRIRHDDVQSRDQERFDEGGRKAAQHAQDKQLDQEPGGLLFHAVRAVDHKKQENGRSHGDD